jgi:hypothetical protein
MRVVPVNQSAGPLRDGFEPVRVISIFMAAFCGCGERLGDCARSAVGKATAAIVAVLKNVRREKCFEFMWVSDAVRAVNVRQNSWLVGRKRISLMSSSAG